MHDVHPCCHSVLVWGVGCGDGGWNGEWRDEKEWKHNMTTKILRHFLYAARPDLGHGAQVRKEAGGKDACGAVCTQTW